MDTLTKYKKAFGEALKVGRDMTNLTVDEIAERIGISPGTYRNLESGQRIPLVNQIEGFAELFGITFDDFLKAVMEIWDKNTKDDIMRIENDGGDVLEYIEPVLKIDHDLKIKLAKEKKELAAKGTKLAEDLILVGQRYHTPNKYLTEKDIYELSEQLMALVDLRVRQVLRKPKKKEIEHE